MKAEEIKEFIEKLKKLEIKDFLNEDIRNELETLRILMLDISNLINPKFKPLFVLN